MSEHHPAPSSAGTGPVSFETGPISFEDLGLPKKVIAALVLEDIETPTPVQAAVIPDALAGHDVLGRARTGSGKTLAFGIPIVARLAGEKSRIHRPRAIVIVPTRELALQVERSLELIARAVKLKVATVYGGTRYDRQIQKLRQGTDIVVATPGRLQDLIDKRVLETDDVEITVLDEADHLCDLGFFPAVDALLSQTPADAQRLLLSATLDGDVDTLVRAHLREPRLHELDPSAGAVTTMAHHVLVVGGYAEKTEAVVRLVRANPRSIVFTRTREGATQVRDALADHGVTAVDLHGNLTQRARERNLERFTDGRAQVVVATDVAARGIHVDAVGLVVHFDAPTDAKAYLHRSGRTARAGESGAVVTLATPRQVGALVRLQKSAGVIARHHDLRTAPQPMTAAALAASGTTEPPVRSTRPHRPGASRPPQGARKGPQGGSAQGSRARRPREEQPARAKRDRSTSPESPGRPQRDEGKARSPRDGTDRRSPRDGTAPQAERRTPKAGSGSPKPASRTTKARWSKADRDRRS